MTSATEMLCIGMACVYTFFGVTLAISPTLFFGKESPLCYWKEMDESGEWFARAMGIFMAAVTTSPWYAKVDKSALAKVYLVPNILWSGLFIQAAFYLDSTTPPFPMNVYFPDGFSLWYTQLPIHALFLILNLMAVFSSGHKHGHGHGHGHGGKKEDHGHGHDADGNCIHEDGHGQSNPSTGQLCLGMACVYTFFGVTLAISPTLFFGKESPLCYWKEMDESGEWFARAMGIFMAAVTTSPWYAKVDKSALAKVYLVPNILWSGLFIQAAFYLESTTPPFPMNVYFPDGFSLWYTQLPIHALFLILNLMAVFSSGHKHGHGHGHGHGGKKEDHGHGTKKKSKSRSKSKSPSGKRSRSPSSKRK